MAYLLELLKRKPKPEEETTAAKQPMTTEQIIRYVRKGMGPRIIHARNHNLLSVDHPDVDLTAPTEDQVLAWNELLGKWKAKTMIGMAIHGNEYHEPDFISSETDPTVDATLKGITLTQVQDHAPKEHGNEAHSPDFAEAPQSVNQSATVAPVSATWTDVPGLTLTLAPGTYIFAVNIMYVKTGAGFNICDRRIRVVDASHTTIMSQTPYFSFSTGLLTNWSKEMTLIRSFQVSAETTFHVECYAVVEIMHSHNFQSGNFSVFPL